MKIIIANPRTIVNRITSFYRNAKIRKYDNLYGWDEVRKDILLARRDTDFTTCNASKQEWLYAGYEVVINKRGWAFAYLVDNSGNIVICDVENYRNLDVPVKSNINLSLYQNLSSVKSSQEKLNIPIGYGWWAIRREDGYVYIQDKKGNLMPYVRFNEIVKPFRKRRDDANIYAIGQYGGKNFKLYLNGKYIILENKEVIRLTEQKFYELISECIKEIIKEIA